MWPPLPFARFSLVLTTLVYAGFGIALLFNPTMLTSMGVELTAPEARTEIRAFYGGLELGLAVFFGLAARRPSWVRPGLVAQVASLGGVALARSFGILVDGTTLPMNYLLLSAELAGSLLGVVALIRLRHHALP